MKTTDITFSGDPSRAKSAIEQAVLARGYSITWTDSWTGTAQKGSKHGFSTFYKVGLSIMSGTLGQVTLRVSPLITARTNGLAFQKRTARELLGLNQGMTQALAAVGDIISSIDH